MIIAINEAYLITIAFEYLSLINPDGENSSTNGTNISELTMALNTISVPPSYVLITVFCIVILWAISTTTLIKVIIIYGIKDLILKREELIYNPKKRLYILAYLDNF
jgi:hypothetical protein